MKMIKCWSYWKKENSVLQNQITVLKDEYDIDAVTKLSVLLKKENVVLQNGKYMSL